jgi:hypothetical protein
MSTERLATTTDVVAYRLAGGNEVLYHAIANAITRGERYGIPAFKETDKLGRLWLVAGGPKSQTYWTEERIIKKNQHDPACTPAYLCDACVDAILDADGNREIIVAIHAEAQKRAEANAQVTA